MTTPNNQNRTKNITAVVHTISQINRMKGVFCNIFETLNRYFDLDFRGNFKSRRNWKTFVFKKTIFLDFFYGNFRQFYLFSEENFTVLFVGEKFYGFLSEENFTVFFRKEILQFFFGRLIFHDFFSGGQFYVFFERKLCVLLPFFVCLFCFIFFVRNEFCWIFVKFCHTFFSRFSWESDWRQSQRTEKKVRLIHTFKTHLNKLQLQIHFNIFFPNTPFPSLTHNFWNFQFSSHIFRMIWTFRTNRVRNEIIWIIFNICHH